MNRSVLFAAALVLASPVAASATSLVDGGFEIKGAALPVTDYCYDGFITPGGPACAPGAWVGAGVIRSGSGAWGGTASQAGDYHGFVQGTQSLSQSFTATESGIVSLSWFDTNRTNNGGDQSYVVSISIGSNIKGTGSYTSSQGGWVGRTLSPFSLVAGNTYTVKFAGLSTEDRTAFVDSVSLSSTAVPEPSSWAMLLAGFGLIGFAARRRRAAIAA